MIVIQYSYDNYNSKNVNLNKSIHNVSGLVIEALIGTSTSKSIPSLCKNNSMDQI